jgi:hypothetical protein
MVTTAYRELHCDFLDRQSGYCRRLSAIVPEAALPQIREALGGEKRDSPAPEAFGGWRR